MPDVFAILLVLVVAILAVGVWQLHRDFAGLLRGATGLRCRGKPV
jgi:hypothetical protein